MTTPSETPPEQPGGTNLFVGALGVFADLASVAGLVISGGRFLVWIGSLGAVVAGIYLLRKRWGLSVDRAMAGGFAIAVAGSGVFGYAMAQSRTHSGDSLAAAGDQHGGSSGIESESSTPPTSEPMDISSPPLSAATSSTTTTSTTLPLAEGPAYLVDLQPTEGGLLHGEWTIDDTTYSQSLGADRPCRGGVDRAVYDLDKQYRQFQATIGGTDAMGENDEMEFVVGVDGREVARRKAKVRNPADIDIDISGSDELSLKVLASGDCRYRGTAVWGDAQVIP